MKLKNLKLSTEERKDLIGVPAPTDAPRYPWGLSLNLDNDTLEKLDVTTLPQVGDERILVARVRVTRVEASDSESGKQRSVSLQITDACLEPDDVDKKSTADVLFGVTG